MKQNITRLRQKKLLKVKMCILVAIFMALFIGSFNFGRFDGISLWNILLIFVNKVIPIKHNWPKPFETVVLYIRFPRIIAAILIGGALALAGASYQAVFKNPLVSPDILGTSAGASFGAAFAIFNGLGAAWV
jgi:iron complex transport system permease protein